jgi:anion transporter
MAILSLALFPLLQPLSDLDRQGHWVVGSIALTLAIWITHPARLPRGVAGVFMMGLLLAGGLPFENVFHGFTTSSIWIIIPALLFGYVIVETGLGRRITVAMLSRFKGNIVRTAFALILTGVIFSLLTPSITVRIGIVMPIVLSVLKSLHLKPRSRESAFLTLVAFTAVTIPGNGWLTGSLVGPMNMGFLSPALRADLDWFNYSRAMIFPWALISVLLILYLFLVFRPHQFAASTAENYEEVELPPISRQERVAATVLSLCFLGYLTTPLHGMESAVIAAFSLVLLFVTGILKAEAVSHGINWDVVLFFGSILSITKILETVGIIDLLSGSLYPLVMRFSGNVVLFVFYILAIMLVIRFVDVIWGLTVLAILFAFAPTLSAAGIHPVVLCFFNGVVQCFTFLKYMSPFALMSDEILESQGWAEGHLVIYGLGYIACVALSIVPAIWYWRYLGFL